ncbi:asparaginase domain-containing protein [Nevskia soli]|uniref:asparaginase domain-containing protein n=1 Tax=Nevskia soli TaxID=418856 RepID=UPI00068E8848|nr:asparaginase domain-containing protein [Nevskia soli]
MLSPSKRFAPILAGILAMGIGAATAQAADTAKPKIAVFSGPTATIQNNKPLITSNKAREQYGLPLLKDKWGKTMTDWPRYQRLAAPVTVYVEMYTAHPLEADVKELYAPPDGYVDAKGAFSKERKNSTDKPVYAVTLKPEDGLYALPYMGRQANGQAWEGQATHPGAPFSEARQTFVPNASRIFEEIERNGGEINAKADYDFYRAVPAGGYTKGLPAAQRTDTGSGDIAPEKLGVDFFSYGPYAASPPRTMLARSVNFVQKALASGQYAGALWLEGSPSVEDSAYWLNIMVDTTLPIAANSAHRNRGLVSADGDGNILDSIDYILSKVWADDGGKNRLGAVMVQDEVIFSAREVEKGDAHPGGYVNTGGYGGILGSMTAGPYVTNVPTRKHTWNSDVRVTQLPGHMDGLLRQNAAFRTVPVEIKNAAGELLPAAIPKVVMLKGDVWYDDTGEPDPAAEKGIAASIDMLLGKYPLAGIVGEGLAPYSTMSGSQDKALEKAVLSGLPVVKTARGDARGLVKVNPDNLFIEGNNLTTTKARLLLTAAIMKFGPYPHAADPEHATPAEIAAIKKRVALYQDVFQTH